MLIIQPGADEDFVSLSFRTGLTAPADVTIEFDGTLVGTGWYDAETHEGSPFRWMGLTPTASVHVVVDRTEEAIVRLEVPGFFALASWDQISFKVDGDCVAHELLYEDRHVFQLPLAAAPDKTGPTCIEIVAPFAATLNASDPRTMSVAISRLTISVVDEVARRHQLLMTGKILQYLHALGDAAPVVRAAAA